MTRPEPIEAPDYPSQILLLRVTVVAIALIILVGLGYYAVYYFRIVFLSPPQAEETASPFVKHQLVIRVRAGEQLRPAPNEPLVIEEFGQPVGRNLIVTTVSTNAAGTAIIDLPGGQYTIRPQQSERWSGLAAVNLFSSREVSLILESNQ